MQGLLGKQIKSSFFHEQCLTSTGKFMPFIQFEEAKEVTRSCYNPHRLNVVTCNDGYIEAFLEEVGGLEFNVQLNSKIDNIPPYIPIFDYNSLYNDVLSHDIEYLGVTLRDIIKCGFCYKAGTIHESNKILFHSTLLSSANLKGKKIILFLSGEDTIIEGVWHKRYHSDFFEALLTMDFYAVVGFNFSLFGGECPFSHALNLKRSLFSSSLLEKYGIKTIPHVYALNQFHINRWILWFKQNPSIKYFTTNCQMQKAEIEIKWTVDFVSKLLQEIPWLHVILQGFNAECLWRFGDLTNRIHLANKRPVKYAMGNKQFTFEVNRNKLIVDSLQLNNQFNKSNLIGVNVAEYYQYIEAILTKFK